MATFVHVQGQNPLKTHSTASSRGLHSKSSANFIPTRANTTQLRYLRHPSCGFFTHTSFRNRPFWEKTHFSRPQMTVQSVITAQSHHYWTPPVTFCLKRTHTRNCSAVRNSMPTHYPHRIPAKHKIRQLITH